MANQVRSKSYIDYKAQLKDMDHDKLVQFILDLQSQHKIEIQRLEERVENAEFLATGNKQALNANTAQQQDTKKTLIEIIKGRNGQLQSQLKNVDSYIDRAAELRHEGKKIQKQVDGLKTTRSIEALVELSERIALAIFKSSELMNKSTDDLEDHIRESGGDIPMITTCKVDDNEFVIVDNND